MQSNAAAYHEFIQIDLITEFSIKGSGASHQDGKRHRTCQISDRLADTQTLLRKGGCPLADTPVHWLRHTSSSASGSRTFYSLHRFKDCHSCFLLLRPEEQSVLLQKSVPFTIGMIAQTQRKDLPVFNPENSERSSVEISTTATCPQQ